MVQLITNEEELENVVGGIKAKHVVLAVIVIAGGKFTYDVCEEYKTKTNASQDFDGFIKACKSYATDWADENHIKSKSPYRRLVTKTTYDVAKVIHNVKDVLYDIG